MELVLYQERYLRQKRADENDLQGKVFDYGIYEGFESSFPAVSYENVDQTHCVESGDERLEDKLIEY